MKNMIFAGLLALVGLGLNAQALGSEEVGRYAKSLMEIDELDSGVFARTMNEAISTSMSFKKGFESISSAVSANPGLAEKVKSNGFTMDRWSKVHFRVVTAVLAKEFSRPEIQVQMDEIRKLLTSPDPEVRQQYATSKILLDEVDGIIAAAAAEGDGAGVEPHLETLVLGMGISSRD